ncbi:hypothetical protein LPJ61_004737 [Coemansia biformis]|uniref:Uncharacterized protein n=1 Tax=Coemansia biformis TaxID=1286918 RepID=A0A9W7Y4A9_9FUNG|nr:hypothetical protein LPJ61_004737 [Coemansia biformis]
MPATFTLFQDMSLSWRVAVFDGEPEKRPDAGADSNPAYAAHIHSRKFEMTKSSGTSQVSCLEGKFEGLTQRRIVIRGAGVVSTGKMACRGNSVGWTFVHLANEYKWVAPMFSKAWELTDASGRIIATFDRYLHKLRTAGVLRIVDGAVDDTFESLIVLTAIIVSQTVVFHESAVVGS